MKIENPSKKTKKSPAKPQGNMKKGDYDCDDFGGQ
jgi:hypothetical protein